LNTRHLRQADVRYRLVLAASPSAGHGADDARGRRVWIKIYEVDEWLGSQGWDLLGSHVEAYVDAPTEAGRGGCGDGDGDGHGEEGRQDKGICDVHTYVRGMDRRWKTGGVLGGAGGGVARSDKKVKMVKMAG
jgi:hypothetical protein